MWVLKISDALVTSIHRGCEDDMVLNPALDIFQLSLIVIGIYKERNAYLSNWVF